jgi:hypothetical protein
VFRLRKLTKTSRRTKAAPKAIIRKARAIKDKKSKQAALQVPATVLPKEPLRARSQVKLKRTSQVLLRVLTRAKAALTV